MAKVGRKLIEIDPDTVKKLASIGCTYQEIADYLGIDRSTLLKREGMVDVVRQGHANIKMSLRRAQLKLANDGNATMLVWLGKQMLNQTDRPMYEDDPIGDIELDLID